MFLRVWCRFIWVVLDKGPSKSCRCCMCYNLGVGMLDVILKDIRVEGNIKVCIAQRPDGPRRYCHHLLRALLVACGGTGLRQLLYQFLGFFRLQFFRCYGASSSRSSITLSLLRLLLFVLNTNTYHTASVFIQSVSTPVH